MDHPGVVRRLDTGGDLGRKIERLVHADRAAVDPVGERLALDVIEDEVLGAVLLLDAVDARDVGMVQTGERLRLTLEALQTDRVRRQLSGQRLDRHVAVKTGVAPKIDHAHAPAPDLARDLVVADTG